MGGKKVPKITPPQDTPGVDIDLDVRLQGRALSQLKPLYNSGERPLNSQRMAANNCRLVSRVA